MIAQGRPDFSANQVQDWARGEVTGTACGVLIGKGLSLRVGWSAGEVIGGSHPTRAGVRRTVGEVQRRANNGNAWLGSRIKTVTKCFVAREAVRQETGKKVSAVRRWNDGRPASSGGRGRFSWGFARAHARTRDGLWVCVGVGACVQREGRATKSGIAQPGWMRTVDSTAAAAAAAVNGRSSLVWLDSVQGQSSLCTRPPKQNQKLNVPGNILGRLRLQLAIPSYRPYRQYFQPVNARLRTGQ